MAGRRYTEHDHEHYERPRRRTRQYGDRRAGLKRQNVPGRARGAGAGTSQSGGSARLKRLAGRSRIQVNRLEAAVAAQNMKNPIE